VITERCRHPHCFNPIPCPNPGHARKDERLSAARRGYGRRWRDYRARYLLEHPLCLRCEEAGIVTAALEIDHIVPVHHASDPLFWIPSNHQPLCKPCHVSKTNEDRKKGLIRL
jgi:5-methylcytosine-specific restriction protein A